MTQERTIGRDAGFTLIEVLVVIGILVLLAGLLLVAIGKVRSSSNRTRTEADFQTISVALEAYRQDFGDYPRLSEANTLRPITGDPATDGANLSNPAYVSGAELLCWALVGPYAQYGSGFTPGDGADGAGLRTTRLPGADGLLGTADDIWRGLVYGPYLNVDKFKWGPNRRLPRFAVIYDVDEQPILYCAASAARPVPDIRQGTGLAANNKAAWYDMRDNAIAFYRSAALSDGASARARFLVMLGDANTNQRIDSGETPQNIGTFLLWSAGPDGVYGPEDPAHGEQVKSCDDVLMVGGQK